MIEQSLLVLEQPVVTAIELVNLGKPKIPAEQIGNRAGLEPLAVQSPLASRRQQPVGNEHEQHLIPARALATGRKSRAPEAVEPQLLPQHKRQPARSPLARPAELELRQLQPDNRAIVKKTFTAVLGKQRQRPLGAVFHNRDRFAPCLFLAVVDLAQIEHMPLHHASLADALALNNAPVAVLLAVLLANQCAQKHDGQEVSPDRPP